MTAIDWDALFADLMCEPEPEPGDPTDDLCPRCWHGQGGPHTNCLNPS